MAITKDKKVSIVAEFKSMLDSAEAVVFVNFHKMTVAQSGAFRRALRAEGVDFKVGKKTLLKRVLDTKGFTGEIPELNGEIGIATAKDLLAPARAVYTFQKATKAVELVGGIFEGSYKNKEEILAIATIPSREVLLSQIAYLLKSPLQRFAIAVNEVAKAK
jgi:large subunit ribosomal protein L10